MLSDGHELLIDGLIELWRTRQNPKVTAIRGADYGDGVVGVEFEDPVIPFSGRANKPCEEIVKGDHQSGIAGRIYDCCDAVGLVYRATISETLVVHTHRAVLPERICCS